MAAIIALPQAAFAAGGVDDPNGVFQLEGDAVTTGTICFGIGPDGPVLATPTGTSCPSVIDNKGASVSTSLVTYGNGTQDWDKIFTPGAFTGTATTGIGNDLFNSGNDNIFTTGSTKDTIDFSQWLWKNGKPQGKDDFEHAYAAAYTRSSDNHTIIVAGADRYDNSGSSTAGFWFVQDPNVASGVVGSCGGSGCAFGGTHKDGDILVISQFTIGGAVSTIQIFTWNGDGATGSISGALESGTQCDPRTGSASPCGTVNGVPVLTGGWSFTAKGRIANTGGCTSGNCMDTGEFLEIGFDLTGLFQSLGKPSPCISTFFAESRSSGTGITSTLSDFVGPLSFPLCSISDTKSCHVASINSDGATATYQFDGSITAKGGALSSVSVADHPDNDTFVSSGTSCQSNGTGCGVITNSLVVNGPCSQAPASYTTHSCSPGTSVTSVSPGTPVYYAGSFVTNFASDTLPNTATASGVTPESATLTHDASWLTGTPPTVGSACHIAPSGCLQVAPACSTTIASGNPLSVTVSLTGTGSPLPQSTITNTANVVVSGITVTDAGNATNIAVSCGSQPASQCSGSNGSLTLAPGASATITGSFMTSTCTPGSDGRCTFSDTLTASGTGALGAGTIDSSGTGCSQPAHCHLCPANTCSTGD